MNPKYIENVSANIRQVDFGIWTTGWQLARSSQVRARSLMRVYCICWYAWIGVIVISWGRECEQKGELLSD